jgi:DinB family protein
MLEAMDSDALLRSVRESMEKQQGRILSATEGLSEEQINRPIAGFHWTIAQICDHVLLSHGAYVAKIEEALERPPRTGPGEVRYSFIGKLIARGAGPNGGAPVLPAARPNPETKFSEEVVQDLLDQISALSRLAERSEGIPLSDVKVRNPFFSFLKMNMADLFHIPERHLEHHVMQIEANAPKVR